MSLAEHPRVGTTRDLSDSVVVEDAAAKLRRAQERGPEALAAWAREWGEACIISLRRADFDADTYDLQSEIDGLEEDVERLERENDRLQREVDRLTKSAA